MYNWSKSVFFICCYPLLGQRHLLLGRQNLGNSIRSARDCGFADEDTELQNFWATFKSQVTTTFLCIHFAEITLVGPTEVSLMKLKCTVLNRMWHHYFMMKQTFFSSLFSSENTGRQAKQAGYLDHDP